MQSSNRSRITRTNKPRRNIKQSQHDSDSKRSNIRSQRRQKQLMRLREVI